MFSKFDNETQKILLQAKKEMINLKHPYVGSEHLLLSILSNCSLDITKALNAYGINYEVFKSELIKIVGIGNSGNNWFLYTPLLKRIISNAILEAKEDNHDVMPLNLLVALLEEGDGVANRILMGMDIDIDSLYDKFSTFFSYKNIHQSSSLLLDDFAINYNQKYIEDGFDPVVGRADIINRMIEILLRRTKNNPLLIGDPGVGKTALVEELARRIVEGNVPEALRDKKIMGVSMSSLVSGTKYRGEFEERINKILDEIAGESDIILFIDEIHTLVGAGGAEGAIDAANIFKPYLARGKIKVIGATTKEEYKKYFEDDKALDRRFQKIVVEATDEKVTLEILKKLKPIYEDFHHAKIDDKLLELIVKYSFKYISVGNQPDKAIDILDEVCARTSIIESKNSTKINDLTRELKKVKEQKNEAIINHQYLDASKCRNEQNLLEDKVNKLMLLNSPTNREITLNDLYEVIYARSGVPIKRIISNKSKNIISYLQRKVIGQDEKIKSIVNIAYGNKNVLKGFLLIGNTGVGKTLFVKEYAKLLYDKDSFIKVDMSEYREEHTISKIIGAPPGYVGYSDKMTILDKIKMHPYAVILLDELEKANRSVIRLFLQVLDDGYMTNSVGEKVDFRNTIIFMTSNLGCTNNDIGFTANKENNTLNILKEYFDIEFINRLDGVIIFNNLTSTAISKIIRNKLKSRNLSFSTEIVNKIKNECNYLEFGARKVDKIINKEIVIGNK